MRFAHPDGRRQVRLEHGQAFGDQLVNDTLRQIGARLKLVDDDALDHQIGVVVGLNFLHVFQQRVERLARKIVAVKRNQATARANQRRAGVKIQGGRRVDVNAVVAWGQLLKRFAQLENFVA